MSINKNISLYIPHVFDNINEKKIVDIFESLRLGRVNHVDFVSKMGGKGVYKSAYIHFDFWYDTVAAVNFHERLQSNKETRLVYEDPWYWVVLENKANKHDVSVPKQKINLSGLKEEKTNKNVIRNLNKEFEAVADEAYKLMSEDVMSVQSETDYLDGEALTDVYEGCFDYVDAGYAVVLEEENKRLFNEIEKLKAEIANLKVDKLKKMLGVE